MFLSRKWRWRARRPQWEKASMGPGCFYPGNAFGQRDVTLNEWCFNGAGMFLSRKYAPRSMGSRGKNCFNGAGMFLSRKFGVSVLAADGSVSLQWGRDVSIPEM